MKLIGTIKNILMEESKRDLTSVIQTLLDGFVDDHKDILCKVEVVHPREKMNAFRPDYYNVIFYFKGLEFKFLPKLHLKEELMNEAWDLIYNYTGERVNMWNQYVKDCGDIIQENKENSISNMVKTLGVSDAIRYFGNYYTIEPYLKEVDKVNFIKEKVNELGEGFGIGLYEIGEEPIIYEEEDGEIHQIESLGPSSVDISVYEGYYKKHFHDYYVKYESLPGQILDELVEILLNH